MDLKRIALLAMFALLLPGAGLTATLNIPAVSGALTIDGRLEDAAWAQARVLPLESKEFGPSLLAGGETRVAVRGDYVIVSARVPEPDRVVARSTGQNPAFWREDLVSWTFRVHNAARRGNVALTLAVSPSGGYRVEDAGRAAQDAARVMAAALIGSKEWTVEAAIPLDLLGDIGFLSVERVRVPRPVAPELRWYWPAPNHRADFQMASKNSEAAPAFAPVPLHFEVAEDPRPQPDAIAAEVASIPLPLFRRVNPVPTENLRTYLRAKVTEHVVKEQQDFWAIKTREDWERFRDARLKALRDSLGPMPERTPLRATVSRRVNLGDGFVIENVLYESRPGLPVMANLYLPEKPSGRIPAIVVVHSHHAPRMQSELQDLGMTWARAGAAVLVMDQLCAGERSQSQPWPRESYYGRYALGTQLYLAGDSLMKWMVWDLMRGIDLLLERPYIDPKRIVMLGAVAGGGDPAAVTAALDQRIAAVIPFNFGESGPEEHYTELPRPYPAAVADPNWGSWETSRNMRNSISGQFLPWFICASVAPRNFLYAFEIGWPTTVEDEPAWARYKKVFDLYGARDRLDEVHGFGPFPGPGECTNVGSTLRTRMYPILKRWLDVPVPEAEYHNQLPDSVLASLTPAIATERKLKTANQVAYEIAASRLSGARLKLASMSAPERLRSLRTSLARLLGDIEPAEKAGVRQVWSQRFTAFDAEGVAVQPEAEIELPVLVLKPKSAGTGRLPVVIALSQGGKQRFLKDRNVEIGRLLNSGIAVCLPDVRGDGELASNASRGPGAMSLANVEFMIGRTLLGSRLKDVRTVLRYLGRTGDVDASRIVLWGDSPAGANPADLPLDESAMQTPGPVQPKQSEPMGALLAVLAGLYEDNIKAVATRRGIVSYLSVLSDRFAYFPQDAAVPGVLEVADVPDIIGALAPRPVLIEEAVDGRNRIAGSEIRSVFEPALRAYAGASSDRILIRTASGQPGLTDWLIAQCRRETK